MCQERLHRGHGSQCGFCSPGMVMSMYGVLKQSPAPDIEDVCAGLQVQQAAAQCGAGPCSC